MTESAESHSFARALVTIGVSMAALATVAAQQPAAIRTADNVIEFAANPPDGTISVTDRLNQAVLSRSLVCPAPSPAGFTPEEVSVLVLCGSNELVFLNTAAFDVTARIPIPRPAASVVPGADGRHAEVRAASGERLAVVDLVAQRLAVPPAAPAVRSGRKNEVVFLGMIHGEHRSSRRYGLDVVRRLVEVINPDYWLTEIPPNRLARATEEFARLGAVAEPRVSRFPEYTDLLFPLSRLLKFTVVATAGWNHPMDRFRRERLAAIARDPSRRGDWQSYQEALAASQRALAAGGAADDPRWIHSDAYDAAQRIALDVYDERFNAELGTGGWETINRAHYAGIARALDAHAGQGVRFQITYGAGHKSWMLPRLRERTDVVVLDTGRFLDAAEVPK